MHLISLEPFNEAKHYLLFCECSQVSGLYYRDTPTVSGLFTMFNVVLILAVGKYLKPVNPRVKRRKIVGK